MLHKRASRRVFENVLRSSTSLSFLYHTKSIRKVICRSTFLRKYSEAKLLEKPTRERRERHQFPQPSQLRCSSRQWTDHVPFEGAVPLETNTLSITPGERRRFEKLLQLQESKNIPHDRISTLRSTLGLQNPIEQTPPTPTIIPKTPDPHVQKELERINSILDGAKTDTQLWHLLHQHVLHPARALKLDPPTSPNPSLKERHPKEPSPSPHLPTNLPHHLLHFTHLMQSNFPRSILPLSLLPTLKTYGPSIFALGASTALYNAHMAQLYAKHPYNLRLIIDVLVEMERSVYEFDAETVGLLDGVLRDFRGFRAGREGPAARVMVEMEGVGRDLRTLERWTERVRRRRLEGVLREVGREG
ncbi:hypothetical protein K470DRAFT_293705 [Piedraia hortae CBS 480.64]|uniref:Mtf2-like C-terminal domain-containing protein n=1 Tax=Piedraia hortae CBS 480.64 TaxID=1314780 RepID=A0A6A7C4D7_9PEZI|nr:hypothetical protein K470DRAFT_293705 [Piedraia hortae CBS 480.64]